MKNKSLHPILKIILSLGFIIALVGGYYLYHWYTGSDTRSRRVIAWIRHPEQHPDWETHALERCGDAPFIFPTSGYIGYLWGDSFRPGHKHQGIDIFAATDIGITPVYAAYSGYLSRRADWKSTLIIRIPADPLQPSRQIWTYYTHLAGPNGDSLIEATFPPGASEIFVEAGTLLGYQGNYSGTPGSPVGVHLHFSIVKDDGAGNFLNELQIRNTLDPSPYFGLPLNAAENEDTIPVCRDDSHSQK